MKHLGGRLLSKLFLPGFWLLSRFRTNIRTRAVIVAENDKEVLLVRNRISNQKWTFPGGGVKRNEAYVEAAVREVREETGIDLSEVALQLVHEGKYDRRSPVHLICYVVWLQAKPAIGKLSYELIDAEWFPLDNLPTNRNTVVDDAIGKMNVH